MLEILALILLTGQIGKIVEAKGHKSGKYKWMTVGLWFGGEIAGLVVGLFLAILLGGDESAQCIIYIVALLGAIAGAVLAYVIAKNLQPAQISPSTNNPPNIIS
jgi:predicted lipid-binding transport protein (Tim44 family)